MDGWMDGWIDRHNVVVVRERERNHSLLLTEKTLIQLLFSFKKK